jgi:hypothetical protein
MRIPNLYLKWHVFRELVDLVDTDKDVGLHLFRSEGGAEAFAKLLRGDISCPSDIADALTDYMNRRMAAQASKAAAEEPRLPLSPSDLARPTLTFAARLVEALPDIPQARRARAHDTLLRDMTLAAPGSGAKEQAARLVVERTSMSRTFGSAVLPSGGEGPLVFTAGQHKGQLAVIGVARDPLAAYVMFTRDPAPTGRHLWDLAWGETVLWLPSPFRPKRIGERLALLERAEPVNAVPGRFHVTSALVWQEEALQALDPRPATRPGALDEAETALFLTRLRRMVEDKRRKWNGAVQVLSAEYVVEVPTEPRIRQ